MSVLIQLLSLTSSSVHPHSIQIDVMVNNAGSAVRGAFMASPLEGLTDTLDLNVKASVMLTRLLAPRIARRGMSKSD